MKPKKQTHTLYRIYYGDLLLYVGRTNQPLATRLRGHFFNKPMHMKIDVRGVTRIEYAEFKTVSDMYLYEIYFINRDKPCLNCDDKARDDLTVALPDVEWKPFWPPLMDKWIAEINEKERIEKERHERARIEFEQARARRFAAAVERRAAREEGGAEDW